MHSTGIDALSFYVPDLYVPLQELAERRNIPYAKLQKGLGLLNMAIPDTNEDAASFAAAALIRLIVEHKIDPREIGRIYLGTESAVDSSKPTATYAVGVAEAHLAGEFGSGCFKHCDVVDLTFACIGAVDAMENCLDWVRNGQNRKAIVIASDVSKYELNSTGEYTQGAGAVALLLSQNPRIVSIDPTIGIGFSSVGDFFKPRRLFDKEELAHAIIDEIAPEKSPEERRKAISNIKDEFWSDPSARVALFKEEPVFDGQYSNECYSNRVSEALEDFHRKQPTSFIEEWSHLVFHLPYAYHGRRIILDQWVKWVQATAAFEELVEAIGSKESDPASWKKRVAKSDLYSDFVARKIERGERASSHIGNMYTASIFMSLISLCASALEESLELAGQKVGLIAYGSGSKAKVMQGTFSTDWKNACGNLNIFEKLKNRQAVSVSTYESMHSFKLREQVGKTPLVFLHSIEAKNQNARGLRKYKTN